MKCPGLYLILILCGLSSACYRPEQRELLLVVPESAGNRMELQALADHLLAEQKRLRGDVVLVYDVKVLPESSALQIRYNPEELAEMNLIHRVNLLGYQVGDLPGDVQKRIEFRNQMRVP